MSGKYIVVFKDGVTSEQITKYADEVKATGGEIKQRYDEDGGILNGFSATITDSFLQSLQSLALQGGVIDYIEPDSVVTTQ
ncbi:hypothetical protein BDZ97DRAFT_1919835 [Flammula alnicola]|nr:hypothetical protein BDZ97DRAFT_1919835 [Flammula alnicola]